MRVLAYDIIHNRWEPREVVPGTEALWKRQGERGLRRVHILDVKDGRAKIKLLDEDGPVRWVKARFYRVIGA